MTFLRHGWLAGNFGYIDGWDIFALKRVSLQR